MPKPRKQQISLDATLYYHCVSRCVRRAFLCGTDTTTGQSYEHRRGWLEEKLLILPQTFAINIATYAIMSNHYHVVLHIDKKQADEWTDKEVVERWHSLFKGNLFSQKFLRGDTLDSAQRARLQMIIEEWRSRLCDISWFMRILNEAIAREANQEDQPSVALQRTSSSAAGFHPPAPSGEPSWKHPYRRTLLAIYKKSRY